MNWKQLNMSYTSINTTHQVVSKTHPLHHQLRQNVCSHRTTTHKLTKCSFTNASHTFNQSRIMWLTFRQIYYRTGKLFRNFWFPKPLKESVLAVNDHRIVAWWRRYNNFKKNYFSISKGSGNINKAQKSSLLLSWGKLLSKLLNNNDHHKIMKTQISIEKRSTNILNN